MLRELSGSHGGGLDLAGKAASRLEGQKLRRLGVGASGCDARLRKSAQASTPANPIKTAVTAMLRTTASKGIMTSRENYQKVFRAAGLGSLIRIKAARLS